MSIQIASNLVTGIYSYKANQAVKVNPPVDIHPYISVVILRRDEIGKGRQVDKYYVYQRDRPNEAIEFTPPSNGNLYFTAMLLPYFVAKDIDESGNVFYQFIVGPDINDHEAEGASAAVVNLTLFTEEQNDPVKPYTGGSLLDFNPPGIGNNLISYPSDAIFWNAPLPGTVKSVGFSVADEASKKLIESNVSIHLFKGSGELLGLVDNNDNQSSAYNFPSFLKLGEDLFQFAAFINCQQSFDTFLFTIGDPETDARVSVDEIQ